MKIIDSKKVDDIRIITTIQGIENPEFELVIVTSRLRGKKGHYFSTLPLFKSWGSEDTFSSFVTRYIYGNNRQWVEKYKDLMDNHCHIVESNPNKPNIGRAKYWLEAEHYLWFLDTYSPKTEEHNSRFQLYRDWVKAVIELIPTESEIYAVNGFYLKEVKIERDYLDTEKDKNILNTFTKVAKMLEIGVKKDLLPFLIKRGIVYKQRKVNLAMQSQINLGHFKTIEARAGGKEDGQFVPQTMVTNKGYLYIKNLWLKSKENGNNTNPTDSVYQEQTN